LIRDKTKNGNIVKDHEITNKKQLIKLEHQLQMSKIKLSTAKNDNIRLRSRVEDRRREKMLHLQILNDLVKSFFLCFFVF
jgi:ribosomal protein L24